MRFVSQYSNFQIQIFPPQARLSPYGVEQTSEGLVAEFSNGDWNQRDYETALRSFKFRGQFQYEDEATPVPPTYRIAVYDTEEQAQLRGWDEEYRSSVEQRLLNAKSFGRDFVLVTEVAIEPPWPRYDEFPGAPEELVMQMDDLGYDLSEALAYEQSKWGQQREPVIAALTQAISKADEDEIVVEG
jgi:hypothetical protein